MRPFFSYRVGFRLFPFLDIVSGLDCLGRGHVRHDDKLGLGLWLDHFCKSTFL